MFVRFSPNKMNCSVERRCTNWSVGFNINIHATHCEDLYKNFLNFTEIYYNLCGENNIRPKLHNPTMKQMKNIVDTHKSKYGEAAFIFTARNHSNNVDINLLNYIHSFNKSDHLPYDENILKKLMYISNAHVPIATIQHGMSFTMTADQEKSIEEYPKLTRAMSRRILQEYICFYYNFEIGDKLRKDSEIKEFLEYVQTVEDLPDHLLKTDKYRHDWMDQCESLEFSVSPLNIVDIAKKYHEKIYEGNMWCYINPSFHDFKDINCNLWIKIN